MPKAKVKIAKMKSKKREREMNKVGDLMKSLLQADRDSEDFDNIDIIFSKYMEMRSLMESFLREITKLLVKTNNDHLNAQVKRYKEVIFNEYKKYCKLDVTVYQTTLDLKTLDVEKLKLLRTMYVDLRESFLVLTSVMVAKNILSCKIDEKTLNKEGRYEEFCDLAYKGDTELRIFNYIKIGELHNSIDFDFAVIFNGSNVSMKYNAEVKREIFTIVATLCGIGRKVDKVKNSADINIAEIFPKLLGVLETFKSEMRGCDRAFKVIESSADIFEKNCNKYIRKATKGGNPICMFTDFVSDIIAENSSKPDAVGKPVIGELKKVILEMRKKIETASLHANIPDNIKFIVDVADSIISEYENNVDGELPNTQELRERQRNFSDIFIP